MNLTSDRIVIFDIIDKKLSKKELNNLENIDVDQELDNFLSADITMSPFIDYDDFDIFNCTNQLV